jgi:hypothetical protein
MSNPFGQGQPGQPDPQNPQNPYGQQQPQPQGYPQPGQQPQQPQGWGVPGQQPGMPPQPGYYGAPPQPVSKFKKFLKIGGIVVVVGVVILGVIGYFTSKDDATNAKTGDCITNLKSKKDKPKIVNCEETSATWKVLEKYGNTTDTKKCDADDLVARGAMLSLQWKGGDEAVLCLTLTQHTTLADVKKFAPIETMGMDQADFDALKKQAKAAGVKVD